MTVASLPNTGPANRKVDVPSRPVAGALNVQARQRIPAAFLLLLALYVIFTGTLPTIIQAVAFGVEGGAGTEFSAAMVTGFAFDLLLLLPLLVLASHPLGILHPLIIAVLLWPLLTHMPTVIQDWGGWAGTLSGTPVNAPTFQGLPSHAATAVWLGVAKFNVIRLLGLACTYAGFWILKGKGKLVQIPLSLPDRTTMKTAMIGLIGLSVIALFLFLRSRGGIDEHLTSLGSGRFTQLSTYGAALIVMDFGAVALYLWCAASPDEVKKPIFLAALLVISAAAFISKGSRGGALEVPMMVGLIWALRRRRIPWKTAAIVAPFMFLAIGLLGAIRTSSWSGSTASDTLQSASWSQSFAAAENEVIARNMADANVPVVVRGYDVSGGALLGRTYAAAVTSFIPRPLWPTKPRGAGSQYAQMFLGAKQSGTSIPITPEVEMYWNFGIAGVILLSIAYGALLRIAYQWFWRRYPDPFVTVAYLAIITSFQFSSDRLVGLEQRLALIIACYLLVAMLSPREVRASFVGRNAVAVRPGRALPTHL